MEAKLQYKTTSITTVRGQYLTFVTLPAPLLSYLSLPFKKNLCTCTLQRHYTENSKRIFSEKELLGLNPNFHIHVSVNDLYIPTISLPILLQKNMWTAPWNI
jgi:hypothetical protein